MTTFPSLVSPACAHPDPSKTAWQEPKQFLQSALDALSAHIAILDEQGTIIEVNAGWIRFACENGFSGVRSGVGDDYLRVCDSASGPSSEGASAVASGIRAVMAGQSSEFFLEYPCHSPGEQRWFIVRATRFAGEGRVRVVVAHENTTEPKRIESFLRQSQERYRSLIDSAGDAIFTLAADGTFTSLNPAVGAIAGISQVDWIGKPFAPMVHPDDLPLAQEMLRSILKGGQEPVRELRFNPSLVRAACLEFSVAAEKDESGKIIGLQGIARDITERKKTEQALRNLWHAVEQTPAMVVITDFSGNIEYVNPKFVETTGYSAAEALGQNPRFLKSGLHDPGFYRAMWETLLQGNIWQGEIRNQKKNGDLYWESASISPVRDPKGEITHFIAVKKDITARKRADELLKEQLALRDRLAKIVASVPGIVYTFRLCPDGSFCIPYASPTIEEFCGVRAEDLVEDASPLFDLIAPEDRAGVQESIAESARTLSPWRAEFRVRHPKKGLMWAEGQSTAEREADGSILWNGFMSDISDRKRAARELTELKLNQEHARRALEHERELNQIKSRFVSMVSHEFRTPLCVIGMAGSLLRLYSDRMTAAERSKQIQGIQTGVERMTQMMEDLLLHGEFETGKVECKPAQVDVEALCHQLISEASKQATVPRSIECAIDPAARETFLDRKILRHILGNLLSNAVKYSSDSQPVMLKVTRITDNAPTEGDTKPRPVDQLQLTVSDSGIGIPVADISKLFQAFKRASNVGNRPGTGMGLAIVKQFVDVHGGTIQIESTEGKGTSVSVWLPIVSPGGAGVSRFPAGSERATAGTAIQPEVELVDLAKP